MCQSVGILCPAGGRKIPLPTLLYPSRHGYEGPLFLFPTDFLLSTAMYRYYARSQFKSRSNLRSSAAATSILPTLCVCEWGMMGAILSAGERQRLAQSLVKTSWGNPNITGALVVLPSDSRSFPEETFSLTVQSGEQDLQERTCLCMFMYYMFKWNNDPEAFGCSKMFWPISSLCGLRECQAWKRTSPGFGCFLFLELDFPKGQLGFLYMFDHCGFLVLVHIFMWITRMHVSQHDQATAPLSICIVQPCNKKKKLHRGHN